MAKIDDNDDRVNRIGRILNIVQEDYDRIMTAGDPYIMLNLKPGTAFELVAERYERYERFYRGENFERLGDAELTRKALEIRNALGRAMMDIQARKNGAKSGVVPPAGPRPAAAPDASRQDVSTAPFPTVPNEVAEPPSTVASTEGKALAVAPDDAAMGDIYFRDGLTYMRLGDYDSASDCLQRARDYDPSRGIILANFAYARFKSRPGDPAIVEQAGARLLHAAELEPANPEVFVLMARYAINCSRADLATDALARIELLNPEHPRLARLRARIPNA